MHSLFPASSAVLYISGADCDSCLYIPNDGSSLTMGTPYYVRVTAYNALGSSVVGSGSGDDFGVVAATPNQVMQLHFLQCHANTLMTASMQKRPSERRHSKLNLY